jgi:predicted DNA repair protein MutK
MAIANLLSLLEDITTMLDQVAAATKAAAKKTAGVVADDMALNAQQVVGVPAARELSVVWAVAKGSALNKVVIVPGLLAVSALAPAAVPWLLLAGGAFLCFEGFEKIVHKLLQDETAREADKQAHRTNLQDTGTSLVALERDKIRGAIRTDFILSAEIAVIALGAVASASVGVRVGTLVVVSLGMTVGVYGFVALIVRFDDLGVWLLTRAGEGVSARAQRAIGRGILRAAPWVMRALSFLGTTAMFLVGGNIVSHNVEVAKKASAVVKTALAPLGSTLSTMVTELLVGLVTGLLCVVLVTAGARASSLWRKTKA